MSFAKTRANLLACTAIILFIPTQVTAQESQQDNKTILDKVVIEGVQQKPGDVANTPLVTNTIAATDIAEKEISSIEDIGRKTDLGVSYSKSDGGLFIRGLGGPRVTTVIDGVPIPFLSNDIRSGGPTTTTNADGGGDSFSFSSLSSLDVVKGADSSRVGAGALGGALVLRTLEADDVIRDGKDWGVLSKLTYDSADDSFDTSVAAAKRFGQYSLLFEGGVKVGHERENNGSVDTLGTTRTEANPAESDQNNALFKLHRDFENGHALGLTLEHYERQVETDLKTLQGATTSSARIYQVGNHNGHDDTKRERVSLTYDYDSGNANALVDAATFTPYWQALTKSAGSQGTRLGGFAGPWLRDNEMKESSLGATGAVSNDYILGNLDSVLTIGGDVAFSETTSFLAGVDACTLGTVVAGCSSLSSNVADMPDVDGKKLGLFADNRIGFGDSGFALTPGLRFDWFDYEPQTTAAYTGTLPASKDGSRFSPKLLADYDLTENWSVFGQWSMAYRAPTVSELYSNFQNTAQGYAVRGNPDLKPETANGFALGTRLQAGGLALDVTGFYNRYKNFIDTSTTTGDPTFPTFIQTNVNRDRVRILGVEANAVQRFDNGFNLHGGVAYAHGKDLGDATYIRSVAPLKTVIGAGYEQDSWGTDLSLIAASNVRDDPATATINAPGYGVVDFAGWWEPGQMDGLRIQAGVYNLFDKEYYNGVALRDVTTAAPSNANTNQPMSYYSEPGRTFKLSLTKQF